MSTVIVGGGLAGLSAAYYLAKKTPKQAITLLESSSRTGGWIKSNLQKNGTIFEEGPRTIRPKGEAGFNTLRLIEELHLTEQIIPITNNHPAAKNRMIYVNNSLHLLPSSLLSLFKKKEPFSKPLISYLLNDITAVKKKVEDESIYNFVERRFGKEVADYLISPMICGICAGDAHRISVKFLMETLFNYEQQYGSITNGLMKNFFKKRKKSIILSPLITKALKEKWSIYSFINGCETIPLALRENIIKNNVNLRLNSSCKKLDIDKNITIHLDKEKIVTDHVISAIPAHILANLIEKQHPELAEYLKKMTMNVSVAVINLQFAHNVLKENAFGVLIAPKENLPILGIIFDSCCFPKPNIGSTLTVMMGGHWFENNFGNNPTENQLLDIAINQVRKILEIDDTVEHYKVNILQNCIPQYIVGYKKNLKRVMDYIQSNRLPLSLCGASYNGVGINDVILSAKNAVDKINN